MLMNAEPLARDLMTKPVHGLAAGAPIRDAAAFLLRHSISGAPVMDGPRRWIGVFTLSDLACHVQNRLVDLPVIDPHLERIENTSEPVPQGQGFHFEGFESTKVEDLMTPALFSVFPYSTLAEVVRSMTVHKVHRVFVLNEQCGIEGVITSMDVLRWLDRKPAKELHQMAL